MARNIVRYRFGTIPSKLNLELRITVDDRNAEYTSSFDGGVSTNVSLLPIIVIGITRKSEIDENGQRVRPPWNPNDSFSMTKFNIPLLLVELKEMREAMKTPDLFVYHGDRLDLNDEAAEKVRRVFVLGNTTLELSAVVYKTEDDKELEAIKLKINNEQSTVVLTLNELTSLIYCLETLNVDTLAFQMYLTYVRTGTGSINRLPAMNKPVVDIKPVGD